MSVRHSKNWGAGGAGKCGINGEDAEFCFVL